MSKMNRNWFEKVEKRKNEAKERITKRLTLSNKQQLAALNKRCGVNIGAKKERARLAETKES